MIESISIIALTTGLTQLMKGLVNAKFVPLFGVCLAVLMSLATAYAGDGAWVNAILLGIMYGLSANGLYDNATKPFK